MTEKWLPPRKTQSILDISFAQTIEMGTKASPSYHPTPLIVKPKEVFECFVRSSVIDFVFQGLNILKI